MLRPHSLFGFEIIFLCIYYSYAQTNSTLALPIVKKCACNASEALSIDGCVEKNDLRIQIWNSYKSDVDIKNISSLPFIIEPLLCPNNSVLESFFDWPFISEDGKLMHHQENKTDHYCIEYIINHEEQVVPKYEKCMLKKSVDLCCEIDEYMDSSSRCTKLPNSSMKTIATDWFNKLQYVKKNIYCNDTEKVHDTLSLDISLSNLNEKLRNYDESTHGNFCLGMYGDENELYPGITYCSSPEMETSDAKVPKFRYCCEEYEAYDFEKYNCVPHEENYYLPSNVIWPSIGAEISVFHSICSYLSVLTINNDTIYQFHVNGSLYSESGDMFDYSNYCLGLVISNNETHNTGLMCLQEEEMIQHCPWRWNVYRTCLGISSFFLVLTLIVYIGVAELRKRISGVCLISELTSLLASNLTLIVIQTRQHEMSVPGCLAVGIIEIILILASFFWLNIMCYDVWTTFRVFRPFSEKVFHVKLFLKYSLYAWGIPILVGILALIFELLDITQLKLNFDPHFKCFFNSNDTAIQWFYLYGIILLLLLINFGFFVHLAFILIMNRIESKKHLKRKGGNLTDESSADIENVKLQLKLFIVMGLPWALEVFTSFADDEMKCYIWVLDLLNVLRGVLIFIIFVCKKSTKDKIIGAWCPSYKGDQELTSSSRKTSSSTLSLSNWLPSLQGRKISKTSLTPEENINMEVLKEESNEIAEEEHPQISTEGNK